jgi:hypothetical protein
MSNSYRHSRYCGMVNPYSSEKSDKRRANRALRRTVNTKLMHMDWEADVLPVIREVSNVWSFAHDGKHYISINNWKNDPWYKKFSRRK